MRDLLGHLGAPSGGGPYYARGILCSKSIYINKKPAQGFTETE
jgi:hypothetical protein